MKNITITLDEQAAAWARVQAAERNMSLSRYVGEMLREKMRHSREYEAAYRAFLAEKSKPVKFEGRFLTREEANDRAALRRR
jgi:hypothetical protein